jgi:hypothetical protein
MLAVSVSLAEVRRIRASLIAQPTMQILAFYPAKNHSAKA